VRQRIVAGIILSLMASTFACDARAAFVKVAEIPMATQDNGPITSDGATWYIGDYFSRTIHQFDSQFNFLGSLTLTPDYESQPYMDFISGLSYESASGNMWVGNLNYSIHEFTLSGVEIGKWYVDEVPNGIVYDALDDSIWTSTYGTRVVSHYSTEGSLLGRFDSV